MTNPKQHHYVPETYLDNFCNSNGRLWVYDKWENRSFPSQPRSILKENFYYAQPDHKNKTWNYNIEKLLSREVEAEWPTTVERIKNHPTATEELRHLYTFLYAMRVRVPNCRKAVEYALQQSVRTVASTFKDKAYQRSERKALKAINEKLGTDYKSFLELHDNNVINISIDPHRSLLAMGYLAEGFAPIVGQLQLNVIENRTATPFICNDNPVIYFPARQTPARCDPYKFSVDSPFEFIFPITKEYCLYHNSFAPIGGATIVHTKMDSTVFVGRINQFVTAFADRYVVSSEEIERPPAPLGTLCPRPIRQNNVEPEKYLHLQYEMGEPLKLPKWEVDF
jgi:hypothetical protein